MSTETEAVETGMDFEVCGRTGTVVPKGEGFAFEIRDGAGGLVASGEGFTCTACAKAGGRKAAINEFLEQ